MKKLIILLTMFMVTSLFAYEVMQGPTELLYNDSSKAFDGYTFFGVRSCSYLLDMEGQVVHTWPIGTNPHLLPNGNVLDASNDDPSGADGFVEVDWDGNTVWTYTEKRSDYHPHHDWERIYNKKLGGYTTIYIANRDFTSEQAIAAGAAPENAKNNDIQMDAIVEVDMNGNVIWEWCFFDHVIQDYDATKPNYTGEGKTIADYPEKININMSGKKLKSDWLHCNSLDYNSVSGHIVINSVQGELYVIDHDGTFVKDDPVTSIEKASGPDGDFLYRFGDPARYDQGDAPSVLENWDNASSGNKQMGGSHDAHWVPEGLEGAGNIMVFNNAQYLFQHTPSSSAIEINPFLDKNGNVQSTYVNPPLAGYYKKTYDKDTHNRPRFVSNQVVNMYQPLNNHAMFSHIGSSVQKLPNGNLFICSDTEGHFFEVTAEGKLAWEYINPITSNGVVKTLGDELPMTNSVFRAFRLAPDNPALIGRELIPAGTITERAEQGLDKGSYNTANKPKSEKKGRK